MTRARRRAALLLSAALFCAGAGHAWFERWVATAELPTLTAPASIIATDRDGQVLRVFLASDDRWRLPVALSTVDRGYLDQLIAYEDKRFWRHGGVDLLAMARAARDSVIAGRIVSGGSTLTMQTARLIDGGGTGQWATKVRQIRLALALERRLSKAEILEIYLTRAPFGGNLEGVRAAAFSYFGKDARRLSPAEAALLVALPQAPEARRPDRAEAAALAARNRVLTRAVGAGVLEPQVSEHARRAPVAAGRRAFPTSAWHLAAAAVSADPLSPVHRLPVRAGTQRALELLLEEAAETLPPGASAAVVVRDVSTGDLIAHVGAALPGQATRGGYLDMANAVRSPGSALKPFVYALAFGQGIAHPETILDDRPQDFGGYAPANFDGGYRGRVSAREALQLSLNVPAVALLDATGPRRLTGFLSAAGVAPRTPGGGHPGLAAALGGLGVTLDDLTRSYAVLARGGTALDGRALLTAEAAWYVTDILRGAPAPKGSRPGQIAFKTGTSYGHRDAWAIGYGGAQVIGVWIGRPDGGAVPDLTGLDNAAPLLFRAFDRVQESAAPLPGPPRGALTVGLSDLPPPLRRLESRHDTTPQTGPEIAFPPNGARVALPSEDTPLVAKLRTGAPPFLWMVNGTPQLPVGDRPELSVFPDGPGFYEVSVIDRNGDAARTVIEVLYD